MARRDFTLAKALFPSVLAGIARRSGSARHLRPVWDEAMGEAIARCTEPISLEGGVLLIEVTSAGWAAELAQREDDLLERLRSRLGGGTVERLSFRIGP